VKKHFMIQGLYKSTRYIRNSQWILSGSGRPALTIDLIDDRSWCVKCNQKSCSTEGKFCVSYKICCYLPRTGQ